MSGAGNGMAKHILVDSWLRLFFMLGVLLGAGVLASEFLGLVSGLYDGSMAAWAGHAGGLYGFLACFPFFGGRRRNLRELLLAGLYGFVIAVHALAGSTTAILFLGHWLPEGPGNAFFRMVPFTAGALLALPLMIATHKRFHRNSEVGKDTA